MQLLNFRDSGSQNRNSVQSPNVQYGPPLSGPPNNIHYHGYQNPNSIRGVPNHGHTHSHSHHSHLHDDHSHEHDSHEEELQGADPEHKPGEVFTENFEKGVVEVDKKPIVPIGGHDHR